MQDNVNKKEKEKLERNSTNPSCRAVESKPPIWEETYGLLKAV